MKVAVLGDRHMCKRSPRYGEALRIWDAAIADAVAQGVDGFLGLGDVCESDPSVDELYEIQQRYRTMLDHGWVIEIEGNHEPHGGLRMISLLEQWQEVPQGHSAHERAAYRSYQEASGAMYVWDSGMVVTFREFTVLALPYFRRGWDQYGSEPLPATIYQAYQDAVTSIRRVVENCVAFGKLLVVAGHWTIQGLRVSPSEYELTGGRELVIPAATFVGARLVLTGHVHEAQDFQIGDTQIVGVGSLYRTTFAERDQEKSYTLVTVEDGQITWERRPLPVRPMRQMTISGSQAQEIVSSIEAEADRASAHEVARLAAGGTSSFLGQDVKIIVEVSADDLTRYDDIMAPLKSLPGHYPWELSRPEQVRTRAPEIAKAETLRSEVEIWLDVTGRPLEPDQRARVLELAEQLEAA